MRIWFDADNAPHVLIMRPLVTELQRQGHEVIFTARDRAGTCQLMDLYGLPYLRVGTEFGLGMFHKATGTLGRAWTLARAMRPRRPEVSFGHGSRALPAASALLGVPSVTMYDYEWVNPSLFNLLCRRILLPDVIGEARCREAGIRATRVRFYPGYKEELYLAGRTLDASLVSDLGLRPGRIHVLLRPPATTAHYHNPEAEVILDAILALLAQRDDTQLVWLGRGEAQLRMLERNRPADVIVPKRSYDGPSLIGAMDLVIGGGGTMTREAAVLGIPSYSFFRGRAGRVDEALEQEGRLVMLRSTAEVPAKLKLRSRPAAPAAPAANELVAAICREIVGAAS